MNTTCIDTCKLGEYNDSQRSTLAGGHCNSGKRAQRYRGHGDFGTGGHGYKGTGGHVDSSVSILLVMDLHKEV